MQIQRTKQPLRQQKKRDQRDECDRGGNEIVLLEDRMAVQIRYAPSRMTWP